MYNLMRTYSLLSLVGSLILTHSQQDHFPVYWNLHTQHCFNRNITIPLDQFGIRYNTGHKFKGDQIVLFYEYSFGLFPYYKNGNEQEPINGGLPQLCPIGHHLLQVANDIRQWIPREDFGGIAVIDFEEWRPLYHLNWGSKTVYKKKSLELIKQRYHNISEKAAKSMAVWEFNTAARKIFIETISLAKRMRPFARWGFYGFPYCNYDAGSTGEHSCNENYRKRNEELAFVTSAGNALFPSIYLGDNKTATNYNYVQAILKESKRIASLGEVDMPVFPYNKFEYQPYRELDSFYSKRDLCNTIKQSADMGANGLILWSTSKNMMKRCQFLADEVRHHLGPVIALVRKRVGRCRKRRCSGKGQCILKLFPSRCSFRMQPQDYSCTCDPLFKGNSCEKKEHFSWTYSKRRKDEDDMVEWDLLTEDESNVSPTQAPLQIDTPISPNQLFH